jgi:hypothetical protein
MRSPIDLPDALREATRWLAAMFLVILPVVARDRPGHFAGDGPRVCCDACAIFPVIVPVMTRDVPSGLPGDAPLVCG